jgi:prepilin-type N-terminal cleavage/methylation domain-containing protein
MKKSVEKSRGVTLIELMIVLVILSLVMMSIYSLYFTHQRTAYTQDEVAEVQQNLRIGIDSITRDIRMAGFLIPYNTTPVSVVNNNTGIAQPLPAPDDINSDAITIDTASASATVARIVQPPAGAVFTIESSQAVDPFDTGDAVTIIRPGNRTLPAGAGSCFSINGKNRAVPSITLASAPGGVIIAGDLLVGIGACGSYPNTITYCLGPSALPAPGGCGNSVATCPAGQLCLMRIVNGTAQPIAQNMAGLQISYLMDDGTEAAAPATLNTIRSVRVTLIGQTVTTKVLSDNVSKVRRMESVIMMRNR